MGKIYFGILAGMTLTDVQHVISENNKHEIIFTSDKYGKFRLHHKSQCCEGVWVEEIIGDLNDLIGAPILRASEDTNAPGHGEALDPEWDEEYVWTFYNLSTIKGTVTIRWYGVSGSDPNAYSVNVDFDRIEYGKAWAHLNPTLMKNDE